MSDKVLEIQKLGNQWQGFDPFLTIMHHNDRYPAGNEHLGPKASLAGRDIGNDFSMKDGWSMYHGDTIPGFPVHPHRGFETVTSVLEGFVDHADSVGATGRYGSGDVQWMTAGKGANHTEMFPLLNQDKENPLHLFQIWLNLPAKSKFVDPHYTMLWNEDIPVVEKSDKNGKKVRVRLISGTYEGVKNLAGAPNSWAAEEQNHVGIWHIHLEAGAAMELPKVSATLNRTLYFYNGKSIVVDGERIPSSHLIRLTGNEVIGITAGETEAGVLLLEGEPIAEPVVSYGPFVMNTKDEIIQAYNDYSKTGFGGWPWKSEAPVHSIETGRFAMYADGVVEEKETAK